MGRALDFKWGCGTLASNHVCRVPDIAGPCRLVGRLAVAAALNSDKRILDGERMGRAESVRKVESSRDQGCGRRAGSRARTGEWSSAFINGELRPDG